VRRRGARGRRRRVRARARRALPPPFPSPRSIFDPCRGYAFDCCNSTFGTPEWQRVVADPASPDYGASTAVFSDGSPLPAGASRAPPAPLVIDETCTGPGAPPGRVECVMARVARGAPPAFPACWNWNTSVVADAGCRAPTDGAPLALCLELGFTQTAHVVQCGGAFRTSEHCGTFLEVHRPSRAEKLTEVRLPRVDPSGYRMTVMPTTVRGDDTRVLCWDPFQAGAYEVWWVLRTRYNFVVERRVPFAVVSPRCDWNATLDRYEDFATVDPLRGNALVALTAPFDPAARVFRQAAPGGAELSAATQWAALVDARGAPLNRTLALPDPFAPASRLFTQPRTQGAAPAAPGVGMGGTYVPVDSASFNQVGTTAAGGTAPYAPSPNPPVFDSVLWGDAHTYTFSPTTPRYSTAAGALDPAPAGEAALQALVAARGYARRAEGAPQSAEAVLDEWAAGRA